MQITDYFFNSFFYALNAGNLLKFTIPPNGKITVGLVDKIIGSMAGYDKSMPCITNVWTISPAPEI